MGDKNVQPPSQVHASRALDGGRPRRRLRIGSPVGVKDNRVGAGVSKRSDVEGFTSSTDGSDIEEEEEDASSTAVDMGLGTVHGAAIGE